MIRGWCVCPGFSWPVSMLRMELRFRNYHLICATLVCGALFILNKKLLLDAGVRKVPFSHAVTEAHIQIHASSLAKSPGHGHSAMQPHIRQVDGLNKTVTHADVLGQRLLRVNELCERQKQTASGLRGAGKVREITGSVALQLSYCVVPKAGCTMWLRVLQFLAGQGRPHAGPMALSKHEIHYKGLKFKHDFKLKDNSSFIESSLKTMTVRDPYTRLWSAYIDKLLLPDFWASKGKMIVRLLRQAPSPKSLRCGHDVTFKEFITYVLKMGHDAKHIHQDKHWLPASDICDPCTFQPDVIGKQETFMADFNYTVNRLGRNDILDSTVTLDPVVFEIADEIDYNFNIYPHHASCADIVEICRRMWKAFQYNGYLPQSESFETNIKLNKTPITQVQFLSVIRDVRERLNVTKEDKIRWRKQAITQAFSTISGSQKEALVQLYQRDCEFFGYDKVPEYFGLSSEHAAVVQFIPP